MNNTTKKNAAVKRPVRKSNKKKSNLWIYIVSILVILLVGGGCFWNFYYTKTPVYSMHLIQKAVQEQNLAEFKKHVDTDAMLSRLFDDYSKIALKEFDKTISNDPYKKSIEGGFVIGITAVKDKSITYQKEEIYRFVESEKITDKSSSNYNYVSSILSMKDKIKDIKCTKRNANIANVVITIEGISGDLNINVKMRRLADNTWQVVEIVNGDDLLYECGVVGFIQVYLKALGFGN